MEDDVYRVSFSRADICLLPLNAYDTIVTVYTKSIIPTAKRNNSRITTLTSKKEQELGMAVQMSGPRGMCL